MICHERLVCEYNGLTPIPPPHYLSPNWLDYPKSNLSAHVIKSLSTKNYALIEELSVEFSNGKSRPRVSVSPAVSTNHYTVHFFEQCRLQRVVEFSLRFLNFPLA